MVVGQVAYFGLARQQASARSLGRPAARRAPATTCLAVRARAHLSPSCACAVRALCTSVHVLCMHRARTVHTLCAYCQAGRAASRLHRNRARAELAAFDLRAGVLLWRQPVPHLGLINAIAAPGLCASAPWCTCAEPRAPASAAAAASAVAAAAAAHLPDAEAWLGGAAARAAQAATRRSEWWGWARVGAAAVALALLTAPWWCCTRRCARRYRQLSRRCGQLTEIGGHLRTYPV